MGGCGAMAPWAARAVAAWHRLRPGHACQVALIDSEADMLQALDLNRLGLAGCKSVVHHADVEQRSVSELLGELDPVIDFMNVDAQGAEVEVVSQSLPFLNSRVKRIHIATHGRDTHYKLERILEQAGWKIDWSFAPLSFSKTPWGYVPFFDGVLGAAAPNCA